MSAREPEQAYYNDVDEVACATLRENIASGVIAPGYVDCRSIKDVQPDDLRGFAQHHFFAGAGLWSVACRLAGWADTRSIWTASCPCQGESVAGKKLGAADPRHLWPDLFRLADACRPAVLVGEQVARAAGTHWLDRVAADLESCDYAFRAVDIPACAVDAPHRRQRLYWIAVADDKNECREGAWKARAWPGWWQLPPGGHNGDGRAMADADRSGHRGRPEDAQRRSIGRDAAERADERVANGDGRGRGSLGAEVKEWKRFVSSVGASFWGDAEWLQCADGKARRAKSDLRLLVTGMAGRADLWRLAGNSIIPQLAAEVVAALKEELDERSLRSLEAA